MKRKDIDRIGILCDQGEAATASNLSECTVPKIYQLLLPLSFIILAFIAVFSDRTPTCGIASDTPWF